MQGKGGFHSEIERLQEARTYGVSRIAQIRDDRIQAETVESRRLRAASEDDDDFIDNTGEDMVKAMRRVKVVTDEDEDERGAMEGALVKSLKNVKVDYYQERLSSQKCRKIFLKKRTKNQRP